MADYKITQATEADIPDIHRMIVDLAIYEKEPDAVKATPEMMAENVFRKGYAGVFIARMVGGEDDGKAVGFALYFYTYSTWLGVPGLYLEDLFVDEQQRGKGLGKRLFGELGKLAKEKECGRVEWRVLKWNQPSIDFYEKCLKAEPQVEWEMMRVEGKDGMDRLAAMRKE
ncbi:acyl-CoA N-acyltransferase [Dioszegia hungarica]|uniref:Acyl-CoA N-acyltransferase n=1 Tax=Dioszegia hungarica TaxID=4972 RepID=A0AA38H5S8_9TREE|nr:acyl-CoA N-acyltransferase [Dioszegia hungarica]XP_052944789.1 acyl-CoA N-acyltransferase [Dioszegia hungarica]KAI9634997.1 acyl-CoA N-acyltransferase [Dioszegia hungarica]KAI9635012.1 acyl-CoA N-acyltransferase [Dioszegia hungarica]